MKSVSSSTYSNAVRKFSSVLNLYFKLTDIYAVYAFNIGFYGLPIASRLGFTTGFGVLSAISAFMLIFPLFMIFFGEQIREWQGYPTEHQDL